MTSQSMQQPQQSNSKTLRTIRIIILLLPLLTMFSIFHQLIYQSSNFIIAITVLILTYVGHQYHFSTKSSLKSTQSLSLSNLQQSTSKYSLLQQARKIIVCLLSSYLVALLITEVYFIVVNVYDVGFGDEIVFWFRVVVTLSNLQANLQLTDKKHRKHADQ